MAEGADSQLGADVGRQAVQEQQEEHHLRVVTFREEGQQPVHQGGGADTGDARKGEEFPRQLPASWSIRLQQMVPHELVGVGCVISEAVHDVADVIEDISRQLWQDVVPLGLRRHNVRPAEDGVRLLESPLGLLGVKGKQLDGHMRPGCENGRISGGGGGGMHRGANMCSRELRSKTANQGGGG